MQMRFNDKPVTTFSCLAISKGKGDEVVQDKGDWVTFRAYMPADKNKMVYTFNAFDEVRERVLKMNLKEGSRVMVVAVLKNFIDNTNVCRQSFTICLIDFLPADDNKIVSKPENRTPQQTQTRQTQASVSNSQPRSNYASVTTSNNQRQEAQLPQQQPMQAASIQRKAYSCDQSEVDLEEFANAIGS